MYVLERVIIARVCLLLQFHHSEPLFYPALPKGPNVHSLRQSLRLSASAVSGFRC
jgi:hypothetical protein